MRNFRSMRPSRIHRGSLCRGRPLFVLLIFRSRRRRSSRHNFPKFSKRRSRANPFIKILSLIASGHAGERGDRFVFRDGEVDRFRFARCRFFRECSRYALISGLCSLICAKCACVISSAENFLGEQAVVEFFNGEVAERFHSCGAKYLFEDRRDFQKAVF